MNHGFYLSYDALAGIIIAILIAIIGWFMFYFSKLNKKIDEINGRINKIDVENSKKEEQIKFLSKKIYPTFIKKGEKEK